MKSLLLAVLALCALAFPALSGPQPVNVAAGINGAWLDGPGAAFPADFEAGGTAWSSLSPHISLVGGGFYGFSHSYFRYQGDARLTASDVLNPDFNTYLAIRYRGGSTAAVQPAEWAGCAGFGWRPSPQTYPNLTLGGDAGYGLTSNRVLVYLSARYAIPLK